MQEKNKINPTDYNAVYKECLENLPRLVEMAHVLHNFMDENPIAAGCTSFWDNAECDGYCLVDDISDAIRMMQYALNVPPMEPF